MPSHPFVPLGRGPAGARSGGQGRPTAGAPREPFTAASTLAGWRRSGVGAAAALAVSLLISGAPIGTALAQNAPAVRSAAVHPYAGHVADAARRFGIPEAWIWAVMRVESNGDSRAISTAGAMGLMQIMPATWASLRARHGLGADPYDVRDNIMAGAAYLREMHDRYGDATAMLAAYNAGPGRYDDYRSRGRPLPAETRAYLARLASITGGARDVQLAAAPHPDPFAWRGAALFVRVASAADAVSGAQSGGGIVVAQPTAEPPSDSRAVDNAAAVPPREAAPADTLFVPRAGAGRPQ
ncbi:MAG: lytic transglycosylase [Proteobacteria bacterium SG_bin5]|nr:MAG: lytic transglycosylase [Proteobacteria bacterium SG_bin5]